MYRGPTSGHMCAAPQRAAVEVIKTQFVVLNINRRFNLFSKVCIVSKYLPIQIFPLFMQLFVIQ